MIAILGKIDSAIEPLRKLAGFAGAPLILLAARLYVAEDFFRSGLGRFQDYLNGSWDTQVFLFDMEHPVPGLPAGIAAPVTTAAELILPVLLAFGLFGRFAAAGMLVMTGVIEFTYQHATDHIIWAFLLGFVFIMGPGRLSLDTLLLRFLRKDAKPRSAGEIA